MPEKVKLPSIMDSSQSVSKYDPISEYNTAYIARAIDRRQPIKPKSELQRNEEQIESKTTSSTDYPIWPIERPHVHLPDQYVQPEGQMQTLTSYRNDYPERGNVERTKTTKKEYTREELGKFVGEPSYRSDYQTWEISPRERTKQGSQAYVQPVERFTGESNYTSDFGRHEMTGRRSLIKPQESPREGSDQPFLGITNYSESYIERPLPPRFVRERPQWKNSSSQADRAPLDGLTSYRRDYVLRDSGLPPKTESYKPVPAPYQAGVPVEGETTQKRDYKPVPVERRFIRERPGYVKPEGLMDGETITHSDYTKKEIDRVSMIRPRGGDEEQNGTSQERQFDGRTQYKEDYKEYEVSPRTKSIRKTDEYKEREGARGDINFGDKDHRPTYQSDYINHGIQPRRSLLLPLEQSRLGAEERRTQPLSQATVYREEFIRHSMPERWRRERLLANGSENVAKLDSLTSYTRDYTPKKEGKQVSCKPDGAPYQSNAPMEGLSTTREDFRSYPAEKRYYHVPPAYSKPEGQIDFSSTTGLDYVARKPQERTQPIKPMAIKEDLGRFEASTNYGDHFKRWSLEGRLKPAPKPGYSPPEGVFSGRSNYSDDFVPREIEVRKSMKPAGRGIENRDPISQDTEYRNEYGEGSRNAGEGEARSVIRGSKPKGRSFGYGKASNEGALNQKLMGSQGNEVEGLAILESHGTVNGAAGSVEIAAA